MNQDWIFGLAGGLLIGGAAALLLLGNGRIAGISGILGGLLGGRDNGEPVAFLAGLIGLPVLYSVIFGAPDIIATKSGIVLLAGGLLVGFGTRLGSGCTSGHGVCGLSRLSPRSLVATAVFMAVAAAVVYWLRHSSGGA